ncbi:MAG: DUF3990 domain-containing protein [Clostridiales bacterium]|jgi:hypothetical protein|nr:DUF3990 domain-containing protein [Clostridiales bacterium]
MPSNIITLYHGTTHDITKIDVSHSKPFKDLGLGFYATAVYDHARNLAKRNRRIEESRFALMGEDLRLTAYVYTYEFDLGEADKLNVKRFDSADREWLKFIIANRTNRGGGRNSRETEPSDTFANRDSPRIYAPTQFEARRLRQTRR